MGTIKYSQESVNYLLDNAGLVPDVLAGLLAILDMQQPIGRRKADFYMFEVMNHVIFYKWYSKELKRVLLIKPKE